MANKYNFRPYKFKFQLHQFLTYIFWMSLEWMENLMPKEINWYRLFIVWWCWVSYEKLTWWWFEILKIVKHPNNYYSFKEMLLRLFENNLLPNFKSIKYE